MRASLDQATILHNAISLQHSRDADLLLMASLSFLSDAKSRCPLFRRRGRDQSLCGNNWLTREGDSHDYVLRVGEKLHSKGRDEVVTQAIGDARISAKRL